MSAQIIRDGMSIEEIAKELGISTTRVVQIEHAAITKLRRYIEAGAPQFRKMRGYLDGDHFNEPARIKK